MKKVNFWEIMLVLLMTIVAYGYFSGGNDWNENSRMAMIKAIVEENRFEIDSYHRTALPTKDEAALDGHFYSDKAIGSSLIGIVFYFPILAISRAMGYTMSTNVFVNLVSFLAISLFSAFLAPFLYSFVKRISNNVWFSLLVTLVICLGTPFYKYSTFYYGHSLVGMLLFTVFFIWFCIKDEEKINPVKVLVSGYLLGYAVITEYPTAVIAAGIGLYILYVLGKKQALLDFKIYLQLGLGGLIPIALALTYNAALFHSPFKTGYSYEFLPVFLEGQRGGLMGIGWPNLNSLFYMTFHSSMGVFWQSPVLLLAFWGWFRMWQGSRYRAEAVFSFGVIVVYFLMMSGYYIWWGGDAFTPRNLIPSFPFFGIPLAFLFTKRERIVLVGFGLVSVVQMFIVSAVAKSRAALLLSESMANASIYSMFQHNSMLYDVFIPHFFNRLLTVNRGMEFFNLTNFRSLIPFFVVEAIILLCFIKVSRQVKQG